MRRIALAGLLGLCAGPVVAVSVAPPAAAAGLRVTTSADVVADDGVCSLREALEAADTDTASGSSVGECSAGSGVDVVTFAVPGPVAGAWFVIETEVTLDGGTGGVVIDAVGSGAVFLVGASGHATFEAVTLTGGINFSRVPGGGIANSGTTVVSRSTIVNNTSGAGGGIANVGAGHVTVVNSTVSNNMGGGLANLDNGTATVEFSTLTGNEGSGISNNQNVSTTVVASIVAGNSSDIGSPWGFSSAGFNVIGTGAGVGAFTAPGDITGVADAGLGPLADNGGPTMTHLPADDSPAVDRVTAAVGTDPAVDQRAVVRPQGGANDAGAVEREDLWVRPFGAVVVEGNTGSTIADVVVYLEDGDGDPTTSTSDVMVDFATVDVFPNSRVAQAGSDFVSTGGTLTIPAGSSQATVPVEVLGDTVDEPPLLYGEWGLVGFSNVSPNARLNVGFFGLGLFIIIDDD